MSVPTPGAGDLVPYEPQTWVDVPSGTTPPTGALTMNDDNLNHLEAGVDRSHRVALAAYLLLSAIQDEVAQLPDSADVAADIATALAPLTAALEDVETDLAAKASTTALTSAVAGLTTPEQAAALAQSAATAAVSAVIDGAPDAANTLRELKNLLDANAAGDTSTAAALSALVTVVSGKAAPADIAAAVAGLAAVARTGSYTDLSGRPDLSGFLTKTVADATYAQTTDTRLSDQRTPTDASVTDAKVASGAAIAQAKIAGLTTALAAKADLVGGVVPSSQIPALALTDTFTVANQAAMLTLTSSQVQKGDIAVRTDGAGTFVLNSADPSQLSSWVRLNAPTDVVTSINGQQGTVVLGKGDVGLGNVDNTSDANKPVSTAQATAIANAGTAAPLIVPPICVALAGATAWPLANYAVFDRFCITSGGVYRYVNWRCDVASGNVQIGLVKLSGSDKSAFTLVASSGVVAAPTAGNQRTDLGAQTLVPGDYAVFIWSDNTTFQTRHSNNSSFTAARASLNFTSATGVPVSGTAAWSDRILNNVTVEGA